MADASMWAFCLFSWSSGFIGTGFLASVPTTMLLMVYMGVVASTHEEARSGAASRAQALVARHTGA